MSTVIALETSDIRFPTSQSLDGSDAMNLDPDYSAAYVRILTDDADGLEGHGFVFTIGRGNDVQVAAIQALADHVVGHDLNELLDDMGATWRSFVWDSQLRWLGPEKGVMHMAIGAVVNALWDLKAKRAGLPLWQLLSRMSPSEIVDLIDFRYLTDAITPEEALAILERAVPGREERESTLLANGYPAYTTTPGWLGYSDEKLVRLAREAVADGFSHDQAQGRRRPSRTTSAGCAWPARPWAPTSASASTPISAGTLPRRSNGCRSSPNSTWHGSRSRRAQTTCSVTPRSRRACIRFRWRPASTWPTG